MKKARLIYTGNEKKLVYVYGKVFENISKNCQEELKDDRVSLHFTNSNELILEAKNDDEFVQGFIDGFKSRKAKMDRWVLSRSGVKTRMEIEE